MAARPSGTGAGRPDPTDAVLVGLVAVLVVAAALPVLVVAAPAWLVWRFATRRLPAWTPLVALALLAAGAGLVMVLTGARPEPLIAGYAADYVEVQRAAGTALLDAALDAHQTGVPFTPAGLAPLAFGQNYAGRAWPYALPGGLGLALALDAWLRLRAPRRGSVAGTGTGTEQHPVAPAFPKRVEQLAAAGKLRHPPGGFALGYTQDGRPVAFKGEDLTVHAFVAGTTGCGKTTAMSWIVRAAAQQGRPCVVLDCKGSPALAALVRSLGGQVWTPGGALRWNPLAGSADDLAHKLEQAAGTVTGEQHNAVSYGYALLVAEALDAAAQPRALPTVARLMSPPALAEFVAGPVAARDPDTAGRLSERIREWTARDSPHDPAPLLALADRLWKVAGGGAARSLTSAPGALDLAAAIKANHLVLFSLPANHGATPKLGTWALLDIARAVDALATDPDWMAQRRVCHVLVDEFSRLGAQGRHAVDLLARSREFGFGIWLFAQGLADLRACGPTAADQIRENVGLLIAFRHAHPDDREAWSCWLLDYEREERSQRLDGTTGEPTGSIVVRRVRMPYVAAHTLGVLPVGCAFVSIKGGRPVAVRFALPPGPPGSPLPVLALGDAAAACMTADEAPVPPAGVAAVAAAHAPDPPPDSAPDRPPDCPPGHGRAASRGVSPELFDLVEGESDVVPVRG